MNRAELRKRLGAPLWRHCETAQRAARASGGKLYVVGGCVRDLLLERTPQDLDFALEGSLKNFLTALPKSVSQVERHEAFGTASWIGEGGQRCDIATTRRERYKRPAVLPEVTPASIDEDLARRDFSVNAIAVPLFANQEALDPFDGLRDLKRRQLRLLHARSIRDDPTRAYRAVRYASRLDFRIEKGSRAQIEAAIADGYEARLTTTRRTNELRLLLGDAEADRSWRALGRFELIPEGELRAARWSRWLPRMSLLGLDAETRFGFLIALLYREAPALTLNREEKRLVVAAAKRHAPLSKRRSGRDLQLRELSLPAVVLRALNAEESGWQAIRRWLERDRTIELAIDGEDLIDAGIAPGPAIRRGLDAARAARLDEGVRARSAQLRTALKAANS